MTEAAAAVEAFVANRGRSDLGAVGEMVLAGNERVRAFKQKGRVTLKSDPLPRLIAVD